MFKNIPIVFTFCCISAQLIATNKPILLQLTPEQIRDTFDNVLSDDYIKILAQDFASKAAEHFVNEMRNQKSALISNGQIYRSPVSSQLVEPQLEAQQKARLEAQTLAQIQAQALVQAQLQAQQKVQTEIQPQATAKALAKAKAKAAAKAKSQADAEAQAEAETQDNVHQQPNQNQSINTNQLKDLLNSHEALNLLKDPEPDGDHLDSQSGELSGEASRDKIPVIEVMKINGAYYRRLLGLI